MGIKSDCFEFTYKLLECTITRLQEGFANTLFLYYINSAQEMYVQKQMVNYTLQGMNDSSIVDYRLEKNKSTW